MTVYQQLKLGAESVTLRDPTQLRRRQCATRQQHPLFMAHKKEDLDGTGNQLFCQKVTVQRIKKPLYKQSKKPSCAPKRDVLELATLW